VQIFSVTICALSEAKGMTVNMKKLKVSLIGAGSISFALGALQDLVLSERLRNETELEIAMMDIVPEYLERTYKYATDMFTAFENPAKLWRTTNLREALDGADFVIVAIEVERYHYWSQDFHIPRYYGSSQVYGENGGPGSMFHTLRNLGPMLEIAKTMEEVCPDAWFINYTNPEAKLIEAISKLTTIKAVGLCHGVIGGIYQISDILEIDINDLGFEAGGLNHFGFFTKIWHNQTGEDLYPKFKEKEAKAHRLADYDHYGLPRAMYHLYGVYAYPGTNHCGEYVSWAEDFYAGMAMQYKYNPLREQLWQAGSRTPDFIYDASLNQSLYKKAGSPDSWEDRVAHWTAEAYIFKKENVNTSGEDAIPIIEAITFNIETPLKAVNLPNNGAIKGLPDDMAVETQAVVDGNGIRLIPMTVELPTAVIGAIHLQGMIHQLMIEAFVENSKNKLMQAILLDPNAPTFYQAAAMIDDMCEKQKDLLPPLEWK